MLAELSQSSLQVGESRPVHSVLVDSEEVSVESFTASFEGGSSLEFVSPEDLRDLEGTSVELRIGYGSELVPYFSGHLEKPGLAYGPFKLMAEQRLMEQVSYNGWYVGDVFYDLSYRSGSRRARLVVKGGRSHLLEEAVFTLETTLLEVAESIAESAGFVFADMPQGQLAMPRPQPGSNSKSKALYTLSHHEGLAPKLNKSRFYAGVLVFRRNEDGSYGAYAYAPITNRSRYKPFTNRVYVVPEFAGGDEEAAQVAYDTARSLERGVYEDELTIAANPELAPYDSIRVEDIEERGAERYEVTYLSQIDRGLKVAGSKEALDMELSLSMILESERLLPKRVFLSGRSTRIADLPWGVDSAGLYLTLDHPITSQFAGVDELGAWIDLDLVPTGYEQYVGEDDRGLYIEVDTSLTWDTLSTWDTDTTWEG